MSETFFGGQPAVAEAETPTAQEVAVVAQPAAEPAQEDVAEETVPVVPPSFGLVRVEPDGSAVITGSASPSSEVQIFANDDPLGSETTEPGGDFAFVTTEPLPTGGVELRLLDMATGEFATTSVVVIVQDDRTTEPLVVASEPGQASEILQQPEPEPALEPDAPVDVAEAIPEPVVEPAEEAPAAAPEPLETTTSAEAQPAAQEPAVQEPATQEPVVAETPVAAEESIAVAQTPVAIEEAPAAIVETPDADDPTAEERLDVAQAGEGTAPAVATPLTQQPEIAATEPEAAAEPEQEALAEPADAPQPLAPQEPITEEPVTAEEPAIEEEPAPTVAVAVVPPTIDAVEIDGDRNFFAGGGTDGHTVRLYVENRPVGTTRVADGRWLVEAINVLTATSQRIRADMLNADGSVAGRAEVNFIVDLPEAEPAEEPVVIADAPEIAPQPAQEPEATIADAPVPEPEVTVTEAPVQEPAAEEPAEPSVADEEPAEDPVPTMVATTTGERTTSGQVIIRRGDNLWTIARRVYGEGLRYTQIYEANADQIRNPDLIYPGQVFELPDTDMVIGEEP
ncbi:LysM peptidoglycan-binding domain-containing protein [Pelagibacterium limicola]|uniref:LysM peptidoglycan-binding domain-containing protein n=1 Tax=Pelagibacterium limicola TaxID=2791022 RepID=UPI0018AF5B72|nr:LysM peptidoglycan-binding domain-containing protein [Pelagibacterium limicola]